MNLNNSRKDLFENLQPGEEFYVLKKGKIQPTSLCNVIALNIEVAGVQQEEDATSYYLLRKVDSKQASINAGALGWYNINIEPTSIVIPVVRLADEESDPSSWKTAPADSEAAACCPPQSDANRELATRARHDALNAARNSTGGGQIAEGAVPVIDSNAACTNVDADDYLSQAIRSYSHVNFADALAMMTERRVAVTRSSWPGGRYVYLKSGSHDFKSHRQFADDRIQGIPGILFDNGDNGTTTRLPNFVTGMFGGAHISGWTPTQEDMLAQDWVATTASAY